MIKIFFKEISGELLLPLVYSYRDSSLGKDLSVPYIKESLKEIDSHFVERVDSPEKSDFLLIPHEFKRVSKNLNYIREIESLSKKFNKKILIFSFGDHYVTPGIENAVIFRASGYKSEAGSNEFGLPYIVQDLLRERELVVRKKPSIPVVGFVGWAQFNTLMQSLRSRARDVANRLTLLLKGVKNVNVRRKGLLLRVEMIKVLENDKRVKTNFIIRNNYGGNVKTSPEDIDRAREEFIGNIVQSDLVFCPRGEGNASQRFFETLSLGRIPLVIDTDMVFPLESVIPYERFVIKVPYYDRKNIGAYVEKFFAELDDQSYAERQNEARHYFEKYLSLNGFYTHLFFQENVYELTKSTKETI